jgi:hypothetical protein
MEVAVLELRERFVVDAGGHPIEVVLPIESYRQLLALLAEVNTSNSGEPSLADWREQFRLALARAGYSTPEQIVELTREIKREMADERQPLK